ncbi:integrase core domain-containing protein [Candidatus Babeliales bacterium]|nr:integrase core domain-containing protein [Candidatus Babeliales bacterium]
MFVFPPRSLKLNCCLERFNGTFHYEFYTLYQRFKNIHNLNTKLAQFSRFYNEKRPYLWAYP